MIQINLKKEMVVGIIVASHGNLADGIKNSASMIFGEQDNVLSVSLKPKEGPEDIANKLQNAVKSLQDTDIILFLVDLWGGTVFNQASLIAEGNEQKMGIITGLNLPMLITAYAVRSQKNITLESLIEQISQDAIKGIASKPAFASTSHVEKKESENTSLDEIAKLNKHIDLALVRLDSRLLHGQVVTGWVRDVNPNRILVVSDDVAKDTMRKQLIIQAAPADIKTNVIPIKKFVEIANDTRFGKTKALVLFENVEDVVRVVKDGVQIPVLNVGSMAHSKNKYMVNNVLSMSQEDVDSFIYLRDHGTKFDVRKVPNDSQSNLFSMIEKVKELKVD